MRIYQVRKAGLVDKGTVQSARIVAERGIEEELEKQDLGDRISYGQQVMDADAESVVHFVLNALPQGTQDRVLAKLLQAKASDLVVPDRSQGLLYPSRERRCHDDAG